MFKQTLNVKYKLHFKLEAITYVVVLHAPAMNWTQNEQLGSWVNSFLNCSYPLTIIIQHTKLHVF